MSEPVYRSVTEAPVGESVSWCEPCHGYVADDGIGQHLAERHTVLTLGSLCAGYGGLDMAVQLALGAPVRHAFVADNDAASKAVLAARFPDVPNLGDISKTDWTTVPRVDILTAGFPCQDLSLAGKRKGLVATHWEAPADVVEMSCGCFPAGHKAWCEDVSPLGWSPADGQSDEDVEAAIAALAQRDIDAHPEWLVKGTRSGVWFAVADAIAALRPSLVVIENVRGILSAHADSDLEPCPWCLGDPGDEPALRALGAVLGDLADLGYDAEWTTVRASDVGAPHQRARVFIVAHPAGDPWRLRDGDSADAADAASVGHGYVRPAGVGGLPAAAVGGSAAAILLKTPTAQLAVNGGSQHPDKRRQGGHGPTLADEVEHLLPTPAAARSGRQRSASDGAAVRPSLDMIGALLPTPDATHGRKTTRTGPLLAGAVELLPTPRATDGTKGGPNQAGSSGDLMLPSAVQRLNGGSDAIPAQARPGEELRDMWDTVDPEALQRPVGGSGCLPAQEALFVELREHQVRGSEGHAPLASTSTPSRQLHGVRDDQGSARAPQGPEPGEQRPNELGDPVRLVSPAAALAGGPGEAACGCAGWGRYAPAIHRWELVLGRACPAPTEPGRDGKARLSARAVEFLMGLPAGWVTDIVGRNDALRLLGNGVVPQQGAYAWRLLAELATPP